MISLHIMMKHDESLCTLTTCRSQKNSPSGRRFWFYPVNPTQPSKLFEIHRQMIYELGFVLCYVRLPQDTQES